MWSDVNIVLDSERVKHGHLVLCPTEYHNEYFLLTYAAYKDTIVAGSLMTIINKNHTQSR